MFHREEILHTSDNNFLRGQKAHVMTPTILTQQNGGSSLHCKSSLTGGRSTPSGSGLNNHDIPLSKMKFYGIELDCRKEPDYVLLMVLSPDHGPPTTYGVLQGTILGLLLFIIYILDGLPNCLLNSQPRMYADDTHLPLLLKQFRTLTEI